MNKTRKIEKILVAKPKIEKLMTYFHCGRATVYNALSYKSDSELCKKIRHKALNQYGGEVCKFKIPT